MKKLLVVFVLCFMLASCDSNTEEIVCESDEELVSGECQKIEITCTSPEVLVDGECTEPVPVCEAPEELVDGACIVVEPVCVDEEVLRDHLCIIIPDPVITIIGDIEITLEAGSVYVDPGVTALYDGSEIDVVITGVPNMKELGSYTIQYNATEDEKSAVQVTRLLHIIDTTAPLVSFSEFDDFTQEIGVSYSHLDIQLSDNSDTRSDIQLVVTGEIDVNTLGEYELSYHAIDSSGNISETINKTVTVINPVELSFIERYMKDHTSLYDPNPYINSYTFDLIEWVHRGLVFEDGEYIPVFYFFLHNYLDEAHVLNKITFVCPKGEDQVHILNDDTLDYAFQIPLDCVEDGKIGIITYAHDEYQPGQYWVASMSISRTSMKVSKILQLDLKKGNLN
ncbi:DUF5011 domain-containing protein [Candidatus Izimaplasma bacterium]|nr:DUF5011 domain-containing protein [Candidatus Izimaplasma bacterium]